MKWCLAGLPFGRIFSCPQSAGSGPATLAAGMSGLVGGWGRLGGGSPLTLPQPPCGCGASKAVCISRPGGLALGESGPKESQNSGFRDWGIYSLGRVRFPI